MASDDGFPIPAGRCRVEDVIERSRFVTTLAHAPTPDDARAFIDDMRREFPDANHNCWAFVAGPPGSSAVIGMSDAGEPHGTAGRPMLDVLLHAGVGQVAAVVTRYFGGTKLGKGGLVRAYGGCVKNALSVLETVILVERAPARITAAYADVEALRRLLAASRAEVISEDYGQDVTYHALIPVSAVRGLTSDLADATAGRATLSLS